MMRYWSILMYVICLSLSSFSTAKSTKSVYQAPIFNNLGSFHYPIATKIPAAQQFFDQGLVLYYGFEWGESVRSFKEATRLDPTCGMCYWGLSLALGSKINEPESGNEYKEAQEAVQKARSLKRYESPQEQAYIAALSLRFQHKPKKVSGVSGTFSCHSSSVSFDKSTPQELQDYAQAMEKLTKKYPSDNDAKALYSYALFEAIGWKFWNANGVINPKTPIIIKTLNSLLANDPSHVGGNHYFIHAIESSPQPIDALPSADKLKKLVPGSEHLVHMPSHIYFLTGRFHEGTDSNLQAISAYKLYNKTCKEQGFEPQINYLYLHNFDFLRTTATMEGRSDLAKAAATEMLDAPFPDWLQKEPSLQWFIPIHYFVAARFGFWDELLKTQSPAKKYHYALGMWHYAHGLALAYQKSPAAQEDLNQLSAIIAKGPNDSSLQENGIKLLKIARAILNAKLADNAGNEETTLNQLKIALKIQHDMGYHEPPDWYFSLTELLGDAYLKWNHPKDAAAMYQQNLKQYPKNPWALFGLVKSLEQLGKEEEAKQYQAAFEEAWYYSDLKEPNVPFSMFR